MDRLLEWWSAYHGWAANLDGEGRLFIIAGSLLLLSIYAGIHFSATNGSGQSSSSIRRSGRRDPPHVRKERDR